MKSSQPNTSEQPPAISASSPRKNPCIGSDPNIAALEVIADDGISYLLPYGSSCMPKELPTRPWKTNRRHRRRKCPFILRVPT